MEDIIVSAADVSRFGYKYYMAYILSTSRDKEEFNPPLENQLYYIFEEYRQRFNKEPEEYFIGPLEKNGMTIIHFGEIYISL